MGAEIAKAAGVIAVLLGLAAAIAYTERPDLRFSPQLRHALAMPPPPPLAKGERFGLSVFVTKLDPATRAAIDAKLAALSPKGEVQSASDELNHLIVRVGSVAHARSLAEVPGVFHIGWIRPTNNFGNAQEDLKKDARAPRSNFGAASMHFVDQLHKTYRDNYGAEGDGEAVGIWDAWRVFDGHRQFGTRVSTGELACGRKTPPSYCNVGDHATLVAGTIGSGGRADGATAEDKKTGQLSIGMAPRVELVSYSYNNAAWTHELAIWSGTRVGGDRSAISNHSWTESVGWGKVGDTYRWYGNAAIGEPLDFGRYDENARLVDDLIWKNQNAIVVNAAGNDRGEKGGVELCFPDCKPLVAPDGSRDGGYDTLPPWASAKNTIVVGARTEFSLPPDNAKAETMCSLTRDRSSWGPTDDGRIKPDVIAHGGPLLSTTYAGDTANVDAYAAAEGTSVATPVVTGVAALLSELYRKSRGGALLRADELRAVLIHGAENGAHFVRGKKWYTIPPTYCAGWGVVNALNAADTITARVEEGGTVARAHLYRGEVSLKKPFELKLKRSPVGARNGLRVTLAWIDPPGAINNAGKVDDAAKTLVNDLDLALVAPSKRRHFPWRLDPARPSAKARNDCKIAADESVPAWCRNNVDNVEVVDVPAALSEEGEWTISVTGPANGATQAFALATYGLMAAR